MSPLELLSQQVQSCCDSLSKDEILPKIWKEAFHYEVLLTKQLVGKGYFLLNVTTYSDYMKLYKHYKILAGKSKNSTGKNTRRICAAYEDYAKQAHISALESLEEL